MGADIDWCVEHRMNGVWQRAEERQPRDAFSFSPYAPYAPATDWPATWYEQRNYWLYSVLLGLDAWAGLPRPRGLPADASAMTAKWAGHSQCVYPSWLTLPELLAVPWHERLPQEVPVATHYPDGTPGRETEWRRAYSQRDVVLEYLQGDHAHGKDPGSSTIPSPDTMIPLLRPATERLGDFNGTLLRMTSLAAANLDSVRAVFWLSQDPMLDPKDSRDLIPWELDR